ncbi:unnamed protein product, partial [Oppiella nova]
MDIQGDFTPSNADGFIKTSAIRYKLIADYMGEYSIRITRKNDENRQTHSRNPPTPPPSYEQVIQMNGLPNYNDAIQQQKSQSKVIY